MTHKKCRNSVYPLSQITRLLVSDDKVRWSTSWPDYNPPEYNSERIRDKPWSDPEIGKFEPSPKWNALDGNVNRKSHLGTYTIQDARPLNPRGRTGLKGRGLLGRWGPNHAADPIVTRWKRENGMKKLHSITKLPILQVCLIQRRDSNEWALPGGMIDPGEKVSITLKREFMEEALNSLEKDQKQHESILDKFFASGEEIYKGYVDDPRNTDNSWMETIAVNFHDETGSIVGRFHLHAGDDAKNVKWSDIEREHQLYASHLLLIEKVAKIWNAHW